MLDAKITKKFFVFEAIFQGNIISFPIQYSKNSYILDNLKEHVKKILKKDKFVSMKK